MPLMQITQNLQSLIYINNNYYYYYDNGDAADDDDGDKVLTSVPSVFM
jgi:hypothetical protein